jgi:nucleotide-binding universal stress UspA family protein
MRGALAAAEDRELVVVHALPPDASDGEAASEARHDGDLVRSAAAAVRGHASRLSVRLERCDPADALVRVAREVDARLLVVGARGADFVARTLRGSVGERFVARAPCDLLVVR